MVLGLSSIDGVGKSESIKNGGKLYSGFLELNWSKALLGQCKCNQKTDYVKCNCNIEEATQEQDRQLAKLCEFDS